MKEIKPPTEPKKWELPDFPDDVKDLSKSDRIKIKGMMWWYKRLLTKTRKEALRQGDAKLEKTRRKVVELILELNEEIEIQDDNGNEVTKEWLNEQTIDKLFSIWEDAIDFLRRIV